MGGIRHEEEPEEAGNGAGRHHAVCFRVRHRGRHHFHDAEYLTQFRRYADYARGSKDLQKGRSFAFISLHQGNDN